MGLSRAGVLLSVGSLYPNKLHSQRRIECAQLGLDSYWSMVSNEKLFKWWIAPYSQPAFSENIWTIYPYLLLLISMLWHRQAIFESKGDKLSSSAECRIRTQGLRHLFASRLNARWQTDWALEDQAKNLNSTARPYDQQALSPLDLSASWLSHLALAIYIFVVVNFDAVAQASDNRIERR